eukprot:94644_1
MWQYNSKLESFYNSYSHIICVPMAQQEGDQASMSNVATWLKTNNLSPLIKPFQDRAITLEELSEMVEFGDDDFLAFAKELSNDETIQQTLLKAAKTITQKPDQNDNNIQLQSSPKQNQLQSQHVIVSPAEHEAISSLYERYDFVSKLMSDIQKQYQDSLELTTDNAIKIIENLFDNILILQVNTLKNQLLNMINELNKKKERQLKQQLIAVKEYVDIVDKGKKKYDIYIDDSSIDINSRKKLIVNMINEILKHRSAYNTFITQPNIKFNDFTNNVNNYYNKLLIDDCDQPSAPKVQIIKIGYSTIKIQWKMNHIDIFGAKPVLEFEIEYASLPKSFRHKISLKEALKKEKKMEKKRDKKKKKKKKKNKHQQSKHETFTILSRLFDSTVDASARVADLQTSFLKVWSNLSQAFPY